MEGSMTQEAIAEVQGLGEKQTVSKSVESAQNSMLSEWPGAGYGAVALIYLLLSLLSL